MKRIAIHTNQHAMRDKSLVLIMKFVSTVLYVYMYML